MHRIVGAAREVGILKDVPDFIDEDEAGSLPPENLLLLCTGSQGEARAALTRIANNNHRHVSLSQGDTVIFSSRVIPGNETAIYNLYNRLAENGVEIITDREAEIHVSGHPCRDELRQMYQWARPKIAVPVHGEHRHIAEHVKLAHEMQVSQAIGPKNGDLIRLAPGPAKVIDEVPAGRLYVDGDILIQPDDDALKERRRLGAEGALIVSLAISEKKHQILAGPNVSVRGLAVAEGRETDLALEEVSNAVEAAFARLSHADRMDDEAIEANLSRVARKAAEKHWGKRPFVEIALLRV
jgi:ribonuclease J